MTSPHPLSRSVSASDLADPDARALLASLAHTGALEQQTIAIPGGATTVDVIRPVDTETLLDQSEADPEQNLPYWAEIWPSGIALAGAIAASPQAIAGQPVLELGSGLGITAAVALAHGAGLVATDYAPESLVLTRLTCRLHTGREPATRRVNWRDPAANLLQVDGSRWPVVLAADVLYEQRDIAPLLDLFDRIVAADGLIWLAEPGRRPAKVALDQARERGWRAHTSVWEADWPDPKDAGVVVRVHQLRRRGQPGAY
jgi:predicted nicotinamide N-methyase